MITQKNINLYLVSDSSGETVLSVGRAILAQFDNVSANKYMWPMIRSRDHLDKLMEYMKDAPGIVLFTMVDPDLTNYLADQCSKINVPCISAIASVVKEVEKYLSLPAERKIPGWQHAILDDDYFQKVAAIEFAIRHDDGQVLEDIESADIVLVGVSRTSKTPTCLYLAQRGFKVANIPFIAGKQLGIDPNSIRKPFVVALTINPDRLRVIRQNRLISIGDHKHAAENYYDSQKIRDELKEALQLYSRYGWTVLDVSGKAIEETAAEIISLYTHY